MSVFLQEEDMHCLQLFCLRKGLKRSWQRFTTKDTKITKVDFDGLSNLTTPG